MPYEMIDEETQNFRADHDIRFKLDVEKRLSDDDTNE
jgi:hypothetical protein